MFDENSAGAVLYGYFANDERNFLLLHYTSGHWDFPKGNVEPWETEIEAARREILEETGIVYVRFVEGFSQTIFYNYRRDGRLVQKRVKFYLARTSTKDIKLSNEHQDFRWLDYDSALATLTYESARNVLISGNRFIESL
jgi:bis(5'-nucleosidyl)-tetraphosphatase